MDILAHGTRFPLNIRQMTSHVDHLQEERLENFGKFKDFRRRIIVATDLMGRGIDVEFVTFVINYDIPLEKKVYLHRCVHKNTWVEAGGKCFRW